MTKIASKKEASSKSKAGYWLAGIAILLTVLYLIIYNPFASYSGSKKVLVIGHAGSGFFSPLNPFNPLPANSMASIVEAMEEGADGVEVDVQLTKDGIPVLYHDVDLESMTDRQGKIDQLPADSVIGLNYRGGFFYELFHDEKIISLETLLQLYESYPEWPYLHLDLRNTDPARQGYYAETLLALLHKHNYPLEKITFVSHDPELLAAFREVEPNAILMLDMGDSFESSLNAILAYKLQGIVANGKNISESQIKQARQHKLQVVLFGGKSKSSIARMLSTAPDAIEVNNVKAMRQLLD